MSSLRNVAAQFATEPVVDARQAEIAPPWRRILEIAGGVLIVGVILQTPLAGGAWIVAIAAIAAVRSFAPTRGVIARTVDQVMLIRQDTLLRPGAGPTLVTATTPDQLIRTRPGLVTDRWQVGDSSVLVPRWERNRLARWRTDEPVSAS